MQRVIITIVHVVCVICDNRLYTGSFMIINLSLSNPHAHVLILRAASCGLSDFIILKYLSGTSGYGNTDP